MRMKHKHDATTSLSLKGADIAIQTIETLIKEGEKDTKDLVIFRNKSLHPVFRRLIRCSRNIL